MNLIKPAASVAASKTTTVVVAMAAVVVHTLLNGVVRVVAVVHWYRRSCGNLLNNLFT